ncbi:MAG: AIM24 family protein [Thermoguttaceae bacterium]|nr:AIM24 family protein [Thermoguttaceae bacterium]
MTLEIEVNGDRKTVAQDELFQYALQGAIGPETRLWVDGKETICGAVDGIKFGNAGSSLTLDAPIVQTPYLSYKIGGGSTPYLICYLDAGQSIFSSAGGRVWMKGPIATQTEAGGFFKGVSRTIGGESFFTSVYRANGPSEIAFVTKMPGMIVAKELAQSESLVCQRGAFLAATTGVTLDIFFQKKVGAWLFGGEGFVMQKVSGPGVVFLEIIGASYEYELQPGEQVTCDTGALAWMESTCSIDVVVVKGVKNIIFGHEGLFNTVITGPGKATFQAANVSSIARALTRITEKLTTSM